MKAFFAFLKKEFCHILRDKRTLVILFLMPILLVLLFGFALTNDIKNAPIAILDNSNDPITRAIEERLRASEYFEIAQYPTSITYANQLLQRGTIKAIVVFPEKFSAELQRENSAPMRVITDASDPNEASNLASYITAIANQECEKVFGKNTIPQITANIKFLYNPQLKSSYYFVPGVMGLILFLVCTLMTSVGIVREKEMGTMEVLLVSPIKPIYIILAKALPYLIISFAIICIILLISVFILDVPIKGSISLLFLVSAIYTFLALSLGILVSTIANTQQTAMFISTIVMILPIMLLSGMVFPIENMPKILQWISNIVPARWYIEALKDIMLKGSGIEIIAKEICILIAMSLVCITTSLARFKIRLE